MAEELTTQQALVIEARKQTAHLERIAQIVTFLFVLGAIAVFIYVMALVVNA